MESDNLSPKQGHCDRCRRYTTLHHINRFLQWLCVECIEAQWEQDEQDEQDEHG